MLFTWPWFVSVVTISSSQCNHEEFFQGWSFCILSLKRNYTVYIEHLPTITKQCITILCYTVDTILQLIEHVSAHTKNGILHGWHLSLLQVSINRFPKRNLADVGPGMNQWMHWLTKYTNKEPHSDMHSITQPHSITIPI